MPNDAFLSKRERWKMFDEISSTYDYLNRVITLGQDRRWRYCTIQQFPSHSDLSVLDLATGTGDLMFSILETPVLSRVTRVVGMDMSKEMMAVGQEKLKKLSSKYDISNVFSFETGDATAIEYPDHSFDVVSMGFGIRNVENVETCLSEIYRVLKPGGRVLILEGSVPQNQLIRFFYKLVFRSFVPLAGRIISGHRDAYRYLNKSVESFPSGQAFLDLLTKSGFSDTRLIPFMLGSVSLYIGDRTL